MVSSTDRRTHRTILLAMFIAIIAAMTFVPYTGFIAYGGIAITTLHVPVIIAIIKLGLRDGVIVATSFGTLGMLRALTSAPTPFVIPFMNPLISIAPRLLMGIGTGLAAIWLLKLIGTKNRTPYYAVIAFIGTSLNTIFVLTALVLFGGGTIGEALATIIGVVISLNWTIEVVLAIIVVPAVCRALDRANLPA